MSTRVMSVHASFKVAHASCRHPYTTLNNRQRAPVAFIDSPRERNCARAAARRNAGEENAMPKCNSRHTSTTKVPLDKRERHPHRSGQEYEYGETPETGLGGAGVGTDPETQCAHHSETPRSEAAREDRSPTAT